MRRCVVAPAAAISAGTGASWSPKWSGMVSVEYPRSSAMRACSAHARADAAVVIWAAKRNGRWEAMAGQLAA